ncbi:RsmB/NOP family class I SAM-dependent RNA methyltransferase [Neogemmobacter tilapiae]|uniref:SAM-dependent methyltransferase n=1 Tax=Neogemmobacter tilapiae TaxID=875041 RepID=A0A918TEZ1_9RHOB|nr:RsmB/NOP family class I SAM-dependent RNA methyltransferase [Gemmobacter tilapiae]GHC45209.1 SAM-dependent methyltransferase [Gemmobacter tilapiae]
MTPAARVQAAIEVLDQWLGGQPVEKALINWGRSNRYAGSGDRAAVRDLVFDAVRCKLSFASQGGALSGRGLMLGRARALGVDPLFTGGPHAPAPLGDEGGSPPQGLAALDCPEDLAPALQAALGPDFAPVMTALQSRAPVFLRVNLLKSTRDAAQASLAADGVLTEPHILADTALIVTQNPRKVSASKAYAEGLVELQDAASQAVVQALPPLKGLNVLDYCAGGGGKTLAMAALRPARLVAHDANAARLSDLPERAKRAGAKVQLTETAKLPTVAPFDLILTDVPCSGSGAWRRQPEAKWALTLEKLASLVALQAEILDKVATMVAPGGALAYATCSLLNAENQDQATAFVQRHPQFALERQLRLTPLDGGDGFFLALFRHKT